MRLAEQVSVNPNYSKLRSMLFNKGIPEPQEFKSFADYYLPYELPRCVRFDSSFERAKKILQSFELKPVVYGIPSSSLFAIEYYWYGEKYMTIFMEGIDYRKEFVEGLRRYKPEIPEELAWNISLNLQHDSYYILSKTVYYDNSRNKDSMARNHLVMEFANMIACKARIRQGEELPDILNDSMVSVFRYNGDYYINIDDEVPSCFTIGGILYIYNP